MPESTREGEALSAFFGQWGEVVHCAVVLNYRDLILASRHRAACREALHHRQVESCTRHAHALVPVHAHLPVLVHVRVHARRTRRTRALHCTSVGSAALHWCTVGPGARWQVEWYLAKANAYPEVRRKKAAAQVARATRPIPHPIPHRNPNPHPHSPSPSPGRPRQAPSPSPSP